MKSNNVFIADDSIINFIAPNDYTPGSLRWQRVEQALPLDGCTAKEMRALPLMLSGTLGRWFTESRIIAIDGVSFRNRQIHETLASNGEGGGSIEN
jgi:hypothetical protein